MRKYVFFVKSNKNFRLNPSYDNFSEWIAAGFDLTGVDLARARKLKSTSQYTEQANQILKQINKHNRSLPNANECLQALYHLPKRPFGMSLNSVYKTN